MSLEIDDKGVVLAVFHGEFDASEWLRQRRTVVESRFDPADYDGKPLVIDMTDCRMPRRDWSEHFKEAARTLKGLRPKPFRLAMVLGDDPSAEAGFALFAEYQKLLHHPDSEVRTFRDHASAYAWATTGLEE
jgi:hypothetical protein